MFASPTATNLAKPRSNIEAHVKDSLQQIKGTLSLTQQLIDLTLGSKSKTPCSCFSYNECLWPLIFHSNSPLP